MPLPRWLAKINKRVFNPIEVKRGKRPVVTHIGRTSGTTYRTPLDAHPTKSGYLFVVRYGPQTDWVRNIIAVGDASLRVDGEDHALTAPRLANQEDALGELPAGYEPDKDFFRADLYLLMDLAG